ncbi:hypothetical protein N7493_000196 [Penicillium malachiteum]|uniref:Major facilitator superfamily (MFS) profile domain-containing protein n=1 Tax=Penicillium malachiteum TaxID=1324776 RepID=A0AAD6HWW9_9EURO|nr:hypothetical protein N7493_000196 [Penicillium malachiteum]
MNTEASPLLGQQKQPSTWTSVYLLSFAFFILAGTYALLSVPLIQLIEDNICRHYVGQGSIEPGEGNCKNDQIQTQLAFVTGLLPSVESIVGLIVGFPYGVMGDKIGRKPILYLAIIGNILFTASKLAVLAFPGTLPISFIIATPLLLAIGGGPTVHIATLYTMTSDLVDSSERYVPTI